MLHGHARLKRIELSPFAMKLAVTFGDTHMSKTASGLGARLPKSKLGHISIHQDDSRE
jgi:hypothetical protein